MGSFKGIFIGICPSFTYIFMAGSSINGMGRTFLNCSWGDDCYCRLGVICYCTLYISETDFQHGWFIIIMETPIKMIKLMILGDTPMNWIREIILIAGRMIRAHQSHFQVSEVIWFNQIIFMLSYVIICIHQLEVPTNTNHYNLGMFQENFEPCFPLHYCDGLFNQSHPSDIQFLCPKSWIIRCRHILPGFTRSFGCYEK